MSVNRRGNSDTSASAKWARSPPLENTVACVEASTTQRTSASSRARSNAASSSLSTASESALRVSGWSSAIVATASATS